MNNVKIEIIEKKIERKRETGSQKPRTTTAPLLPKPTGRINGQSMVVQGQNPQLGADLNSSLFLINPLYQQLQQQQQLLQLLQQQLPPQQLQQLQLQQLQLQQQQQQQQQIPSLQPLQPLQPPVQEQKKQSQVRNQNHQNHQNSFIPPTQPKSQIQPQIQQEPSNSVAWSQQQQQESTEWNGDYSSSQGTINNFSSEYFSNPNSSAPGSPTGNSQNSNIFPESQSQSQSISQPLPVLQLPQSYPSNSSTIQTPIQTTKKNKSRTTSPTQTPLQQPNSEFQTTLSLPKQEIEVDDSLLAWTTTNFITHQQDDPLQSYVNFGRVFHSFFFPSLFIFIIFLFCFLISLFILYFFLFFCKTINSISNI